MSLLGMVKGPHGPHAFCIYSFLRLQQARHVHQVSQREIARSLGFSRSTVNKALGELKRRLYVQVNGTVELIGAGPVRSPGGHRPQDPNQATLPFMAGPKAMPGMVTPGGFEPPFSDRKSDSITRGRRNWGRGGRGWRDISSLSHTKPIGRILNEYRT